MHRTMRLAFGRSGLGQDVMDPLTEYQSWAATPAGQAAVTAAAQPVPPAAPFVLPFGLSWQTGLLLAVGAVVLLASRK